MNRKDTLIQRSAIPKIRYPDTGRVGHGGTVLDMDEPCWTWKNRVGMANLRNGGLVMWQASELGEAKLRSYKEYKIAENTEHMTELSTYSVVAVTKGLGNSNGIIILMSNAGKSNSN